MDEERAPADKRPWLAPLLLGVVATVLAAVGSWGASPTMDEPTYVGQGAYLVHSGDFAAPVLLWQPPLSLYVTSAALPAVELRPGEFDRRPDPDSMTDLGDRLLFESPSPPAAVLRASRVPVMLVTGLLAALAAWLAARMAGRISGWIAGGLVALSPAVYGHGGLATTDVIATTTYLAAAAGAVAVVERADRRRLLVSGVLLGLALLTKLTAVVLVPLLAVVVVVSTRRAGGGWLRAVGACGLAFLAAGVVVWAGYGFHTATLVSEQSTGDLAARLADRTPLPAAWVEWFARTVPVPAPRLWQSAVFQQSKLTGRLYFRFFDETSTVGWLAYFPVVTLGKMTLGSLGMGLLALVSLLWKRPGRAGWVLLAACALPFAAAVLSRHNLGVRHVLPALCPLAVLVAVQVVRGSRGHAFLLVALLFGGVHAVEGLSGATAPVAWWNAAAGGTGGGWRIAADSNADWGQGLWRLRETVRERDLGPVYLLPRVPRAALDHLDEDAFRPVRVPEDEDWSVLEGWVAVSTSTVWQGNRVPVTGAAPEELVAGCYRLYRLPLVRQESD